MRLYMGHPSSVEIGEPSESPRERTLVDTTNARTAGSSEVVALPGVRTGRAGIEVLRVDAVVVSVIGL